MTRRALVGVVVAACALAVSSSPRSSAAPRFTTPIHHVVVIYQENHSFDNVLGQLCIVDARSGCDAASSGQLIDGSTVALTRATDIVPNVFHLTADQTKAVNGGAMNGFNTIGACHHLECYSAFDPSQIPSLAALARSGAISDRYFSAAGIPSWGGHVDFAAQTLDGFVGDNPRNINGNIQPGWGCDSNRDAAWNDPVTQSVIFVPSCIPDQNGVGPYRPSPVQYVPTMMDRMDAAGVSWRIYGSSDPTLKHDRNAYRWSVCPAFAECLYSSQKNNMMETDQILTDVANGTLPNFSFIVPSGPEGQTAQHNSNSMIIGDNWIGKVVSAIQNGPDWASTTIFITYDDCGCFYDHVPPPPGLGIRLPLVIVSPYARAAFTDHGVATDSSILGYAEHVLGFAPLQTTSRDGTAYAFRKSFNYNQVPTRPFVFHPTSVPKSSLAYVRTHPPDGEDS